MLTTGAPTELSSYAYYGGPIHAVADGEIVAVFVELQDQLPGANPPVGSLTLDQYSGNHVVQRFEQNGQTYDVLYAHLKPGTAKAAVTLGQTVSAGDVLGELGNPGQPLTLAPGGQSGERTDEMSPYLDLVNLTAAASPSAGSPSSVSSSSAPPSSSPSSAPSS